MINGSHEISLNFKSYYVIKDERIDSIFAAFCMMVNFQAGVGKRFISNSDIVQQSFIRIVIGCIAHNLWPSSEARWGP